MGPPAPVVTDVIHPQARRYSLLNSVEFSPAGDRLCVTLTHRNEVQLYKIDQGKATLAQRLRNPWARLREPQYAGFTPDGSRLVVTNWHDATLALYTVRDDGSVKARPSEVQPLAPGRQDLKPHGLALAGDGRMAVAFGTNTQFHHALRVGRLDDRGVEWTGALEQDALPGIPKGVAFSPDGTHLLVSFSDRDLIGVFSLGPDGLRLEPRPVQLLAGGGSGLSRPEDLKVAPSGATVAVTNSGADSVTFHAWDSSKNRFLRTTPSQTLGPPGFSFRCPHGVAYSPDGRFLAVSEFGPLPFTPRQDVLFDKATPRDFAKVQVLRLDPDA